ncbi:hypothetical protein IMCC3088_313 [Aequoribacter fuscus]|uniref:Uncharacterized protein n=1 Tax=Aequoribacter fuscus TaxID=2518989 RepID=F3L5N3_9GAMM|nr:hypothetical protein IMCC3088_313 [Aequoribacter fuscus]
MTANAGDIIFLQQVAEMGIVMAKKSVFQLPDYEGNIKSSTSILEL